MDFLSIVLISFIFLGLVIITVVLVQHSSKLKTLFNKHDALQTKLDTHKDDQERIMKNLIDSINYNDKVASIDNNKLQHYISHAVNDSNEKMKVFDSSLKTVQKSTNSNIQTMDDNLRYNVSKLYSDTHDLDTKYTHLMIDTAEKINAGNSRMDRLEGTKLDSQEFMTFKNSDFEEHRQNLAENVQDVHRLSVNSQ